MNKKSYLIAAAVGLALVVWMLSGLLIGSDSDSQAQTAATSEAAAPMRVEVETHTAEAVELSIENQGDTQALHDIQLRAETTGRVAEVLAREGERVTEGDLVVRLAAGDRDARQAEAQAAVAQAQADFDAAERLQGEGYQSSIAVSGAQAALAAAKARLKTINQEITDTRIRAPIDGVLESRAAEVGDYVSVGDAVARILVNDPLIVVAQVAQQDINAIELGREAEVELATGDTLTGRVRYISAAAESGSRTFRVEIEADNPDSVPAGVSATIRIPIEPVEAHFLSPAWLSLRDSGQVGVKGVDEDDLVVFHPVDIVRTERDGVWVSGLPERLRVITTGQGYVREGEPVTPVVSED